MFIQDEKISESKAAPAGELNSRRRGWPRDIDPGNVMLDIGGGVIVVDTTTERLDIEIVKHAVCRADDMCVVKKCRFHQGSVARFGCFDIRLQGFLDGSVLVKTLLVKTLRLVRSGFGRCGSILL